jgi:hypothetical protein
MKRNSILGRFKPRQHHKLLNKGKAVTYRSMWERKVMLYCDRSTAVLKWGSEVVGIRYHDSTKDKWRTYYPDVLIVYRDEHNRINHKIVEIKPASQCSWQINRDKWLAARQYCDSMGYIFQVLTEKEIQP